MATVTQEEVVLKWNKLPSPGERPVSRVRIDETGIPYAYPASDCTDLGYDSVYYFIGDEEHTYNTGHTDPYVIPGASYRLCLGVYFWSWKDVTWM